MNNSLSSFFRTILCIYSLLGIIHLYGSTINENEKNQLDSLYSLLNNTDLHDTVLINIKVEIGESEPIYRFGYWDSISNDCNDVLATTINSEINKRILTLLSSINNNP